MLLFIPIVVTKSFLLIFYTKFSHQSVVRFHRIHFLTYLLTWIFFGPFLVIESVFYDSMCHHGKLEPFNSNEICDSGSGTSWVQFGDNLFIYAISASLLYSSVSKLLIDRQHE